MKVEFPFSYRVAPIRTSTRRGRNAGPESMDFRRALLEVDVPEVSKADLPLAASVRHTPRVSFERSAEVSYRLHEGRLVRPVLDGRSRPMSVDDVVAAATKKGDALEAYDAFAFWTEYPFYVGREGYVEWSASKWSPWEAETDWKTFEREREERVAALSWASDGLVMAGGVLYQRVQEPTFSFDIFPNGAFGRISIDPGVLPGTLEFKLDEPAKGMFIAEWGKRTGDRVWGDPEDDAQIVRPDRFTADRAQLLTTSFVWTFARRFREFEPYVGKSEARLLRDFRAAADEIGKSPIGTDFGEAHVSLLTTVGDLVAATDRSAFPTKVMQKRFEHVREVALAGEIAWDIFGHSLEMKGAMYAP